MEHFPTAENEDAEPLVDEGRTEESQEVEAEGPIDTVVTSHGSTYRYLEDGTTQRYKKAEGKEYDPQPVLVYIPNYDWLHERLPEVVGKLGENEGIYEEVLLEYAQAKGKTMCVVDQDGRKLETNEEVSEALDHGTIAVAFMTGNTVDFLLPTTNEPRMGFYTFDTRKYIDEESGELMRERHLGHKVVGITRKSTATAEEDLEDED